MSSPLRQITKEFEFKPRESILFAAFYSSLLLRSQERTEGLLKRIYSETDLTYQILDAAITRCHELDGDYKPGLIKPILASSLKEAEQMKREGKDPIIVRANEEEIYVFTQNEDISDNIWIGGNWSSSHLGPNDPYEKYTFTRLDEQQLMKHLANPEKFMGEN